MTEAEGKVNAVVLDQSSTNRQDSVLLTDQYELTMAYGYWKTKSHTKEAVFTLSFRKNPFGGGFAVFCGLDQIVKYVSKLHFAKDEIEYLRSLKAPGGSELFESEFLDYLETMKFDVDIDCVPEGTIVFAHEPILRVRGPIMQAQLLETALLNFVGFPTLVATKAARIKLAAGDKPVLEFGLRRSQGPNGGVMGSLAAYIGGCEGTSNVLAGKVYGIPVMGTHAHSWIMSFGDEKQAFEKFAEAMPNNTFFLVDTYDTINGIKNAIEVGKSLRSNGYDLLGIRLDSGDLAYLSLEARRLLDENGFSNTRIVASNNLDEGIITSLNDQGAQIDVWAVGTKLATCDDQPSLGAVYKLSAIRSPGESWRPTVKISEQTLKISNPGILQARRFFYEEDGKVKYIADMIFDEEMLGTGNEWTIVDPADFTRRKKIDSSTKYRDLLVPIFKKGKPVYKPPSFAESRQLVLDQLACLHSGIKRLLNPHQYPVGLEMKTHELKTELILQGRGLADD